MKKCLIFICLIFVSLNAFAESVYTYDLTKDLIIGTVSLGLTATSFFIGSSSSGASPNAVLQKDDVNPFDRSMMFSFNKPLDLTSTIATFGLAVLPVVSLAGNITSFNAWLTYGIMYGESALLVYGTSEILKDTVMRYRPYFYFGEIPSGQESDYYKSFPSRHTAFAFMSAGFLTSTFFSEYPDSPWKIPVCAVSYTLAAGIGAARLLSGNHFMTDIIAGAAIGTVYGYLIPWLHLRKDDKVTLTPIPNGLMVSLKF
ncbi:MAG: phosphatase PAP2 family protein [Treponema sp.]|nr:phosphatase PAP2 family protein [Treponema sp.]